MKIMKYLFLLLITYSCAVVHEDKYDNNYIMSYIKTDRFQKYLSSLMIKEIKIDVQNEYKEISYIIKDGGYVLFSERESITKKNSEVYEYGSYKIYQIIHDSKMNNIYSLITTTKINKINITIYVYIPIDNKKTDYDKDVYTMKNPEAYFVETMKSIIKYIENKAVQQAGGANS